MFQGQAGLAHPPRGWQAAFPRWALAGVILLAAVGVRFWIDPLLPSGFPFLTFLPAVLLTAYFLGDGPGSAVALLGGAAAITWFMPPYGLLALTGEGALAVAFYVFTVAVIILLIARLKRSILALDAERQVNADLAASRQLMFRELQHRVSNNLSTVSALLNMQRRALDDPSAQAALDAASRRIALIARLMRHLHDPEGQSVDIGRFLTVAGQDMLESSGAADRVRLSVDATRMMVGPEVSVPLGLIATELVANTLEHGFPDQATGEVSLSLRRLGARRAVLTITDNGRGVPADFDVDQTRSLGLAIARQFARQLGGALAIMRRPEGGTRAHVEFDCGPVPEAPPIRAQATAMPVVALP